MHSFMMFGVKTYLDRISHKENPTKEEFDELLQLSRILHEQRNRICTEISEVLNESKSEEYTYDILRSLNREIDMKFKKLDESNV